MPVTLISLQLVRPLVKPMVKPMVDSGATPATLDLQYNGVSLVYNGTNLTYNKG